jgi:hypothetical protein
MLVGPLPKDIGSGPTSEATGAGLAGLELELQAKAELNDAGLLGALDLAKKWAR